jgi:hypothetical protein
MSYLDITNLYKEQDILLFRECYALEKIHGSSAHISWNKEEVKFFAGGESHVAFVALFDAPALAQHFKDIFGADKVIVYGEVYGGKCQKMSQTYGPHLKFVVFDIKVGESWLNVPNAADVAQKLGLEFVYFVKISTDLAAIDAERDADSVQAVRNGMGTGKMREGVVLRPLIELTKNNGGRVICKHKRDKFAERQHVPKVVDADKQAILTEAQAIADEWVVAMRLEHILQEHPEATGMEHTPIIIKAMIADVYKEAVGEIVESRDVAAAIGRKAAELWKKKVKTMVSG